MSRDPLDPLDSALGDILIGMVALSFLASVVVLVTTLIAKPLVFAWFCMLVVVFIGLSYIAGRVVTP